MNRTLEDIRENLPFVGCDNDTALELCAEVERLQAVVDRLRKACGTVSDKTAAIVRTMPFELVGTPWSQALSDASAIAFRASCEAAEKARTTCRRR